MNIYQVLIICSLIILIDNIDYCELSHSATKPDDCKIDDKLRIVSFEKLKGVWDNKYYPIVWFCPDWKHVKQDFFYADHKENEIVERILSKRMEKIDKLEDVYKELEKTDEINAFVEECSKKNFSKERSFLLQSKTKK